MDITSVPGPLAAPTVCASCVFGAYSSRVLSFTSSYIEHITVSVTPHITVYTNGSRSTSFESNTLTESAIVGGIAGANSSKTFSKKQDITWTVDGATLTYPTKYVQYLGFSGAAAPTDEGDTCAEQTDASAIILAETTDAASFIYALPANATALALPTPLLQYLGGLDDLVEQFDGAALTGCAPLAGDQQLGGNYTGPIYTTIGNSSQIFPSDYVAPGSSLHPTSSSGSHGNTGTSSGLVSRPHAPSTGYSMSSTRSEADPVMRILPITNSSSGDIIPGYATSSSKAEVFSTNLTPKSHTTSSSPSSRSSEVSHASPDTISHSQLSILPHPYLNTTNSRPPTYSETSSEASSSSSQDSSISSATIGISNTPSSSLNYLTSDPSSTTTHPGGVFYPSFESVASSTTKTSTPPKGAPGPAEENGSDDDDNLTATSAPAMTTRASATEAATATAPEASTPESYGEGENVHTTAFVIDPITGRALITYASEPTRTVDHETPPSYTVGAGGGDSGGIADGESQGDGTTGDVAGNAGADQHVADPTPTPDLDVSNLVDQIGQVVDEQGDGSDSPSTNVPSSNVADNDESAAAGSQGPESSNRDRPGENSSDSDGPGAESSAPSNSEPEQGIDLGTLNSAINSVAAQEGGDGATAVAQPTLPGTADSQPGPVYSAGNTVVTAQSDGAVVLGEQTVAPGQSITIGSGPSTTVVALQTSGGKTNLVVAGSTYVASPGAVTAQSDGAVVFAGLTVQPGQSLTIGSGPSATVVELQTNDGSTNLVVGGSTMQVLPDGGTITAGPGSGSGVGSIALITTDGSTITAIQSGSSLILQDGASTTTVAAGQAATFAGQTILAVPTEDALFVNGNITPLTAAEGVEGPLQAVITADGHSFTAVDAGDSVLLVDGSVTQTLQDGSHVVFQGQTISAQQSGMAVVVNGHTSSLTSALAFATGQAVVTADGQTFSALHLPGYVVLQDGSSTLTLRDGATATFDGQIVAALPSGDAVVVNGQTMSMTEPVTLATAQAVVTAEGHTLTALDMDGYVILQDGTSTTTVQDGKTATFAGQTIQAVSAGDAIVVNGRTASLTSVEASSTASMDEYIYRGIAGDDPASSPTNGATVDTASDEPTGTANAAAFVSASWSAFSLTCLLGVVAML